jgi:hypothetical protein
MPAKRSSQRHLSGKQAVYTRRSSNTVFADRETLIADARNAIQSRTKSIPCTDNRNLKQRQSDKRKKKREESTQRVETRVQSRLVEPGKHPLDKKLRAFWNKYRTKVTSMNAFYILVKETKGLDFQHTLARDRLPKLIDAGYAQPIKTSTRRTGEKQKHTAENLITHAKFRLTDAQKQIVRKSRFTKLSTADIVIAGARLAIKKPKNRYELFTEASLLFRLKTGSTEADFIGRVKAKARTL